MRVPEAREHQHLTLRGAMHGRERRRIVTADQLVLELLDSETGAAHRVDAAEDAPKGALAQAALGPVEVGGALCEVGEGNLHRQRGATRVEGLQ